MTRRLALLLLVSLETGALFTLGILSSRLSSSLDLPPVAVLALAAILILVISALVIARQEARENPKPAAGKRQPGIQRLVPQSMLATFPLGMGLGLLITIPSVVLVHGSRLFTIPFLVLSDRPPGVQVDQAFGFAASSYEVVGSSLFFLIAAVTVTFIGPHRTAAMIAGWAVGASVGVCASAARKPDLVYVRWLRTPRTRLGMDHNPVSRTAHSSPSVSCCASVIG
jgi:hypothetical protein